MRRIGVKVKELVKNQLKIIINKMFKILNEICKFKIFQFIKLYTKNPISG